MSLESSINQANSGFPSARDGGLRELSANELAMDVLNRNGNGSFNVLTCSTIEGHLPIPIVEEALSILLLQQPLLRARIDTSGDQAKFTTDGAQRAEVTTLLLSEYVSLPNVIDAQLNSPLDSQRSLFRIFLVTSGTVESPSYLLTVLHHAICDGQSCLDLHAQLFNICDKILSGIPVSVTPKHYLPTLRSILPPDAVGLGGRIRELVFGLRSFVLPILYPPLKLRPEATLPIKDRRCCWYQRVFTADETNQIVALSRCQSLRVQPLICAALGLALLQESRSSEDAPPNIRNLFCRSYVDLRRRLYPPIPSSTLGFLASSVTTLHRVMPHCDLVSLAREVDAKLRAGLKARDYLPAFTLFTPSVVHHFLKTPDDYPLTFDVSNSGVFLGETQFTGFRWTQSFFIPTNVIFGRIVTCAVSTFSGQMIINLVASAPSIGLSTMQRIANRMVETLGSHASL